jgi:TolB-like protein
MQARTFELSVVSGFMPGDGRNAAGVAIASMGRPRSWGCLGAWAYLHRFGTESFRHLDASGNDTGAVSADVLEPGFGIAYQTGWLTIGWTGGAELEAVQWTGGKFKHAPGIMGLGAMATFDSTRFGISYDHMLPFGGETAGPLLARFGGAVRLDKPLALTIAGDAGLPLSSSIRVPAMWSAGVTWAVKPALDVRLGVQGEGSHPAVLALVGGLSAHFGAFGIHYGADVPTGVSTGSSHAAGLNWSFGDARSFYEPPAKPAAVAPAASGFVAQGTGPTLAVSNFDPQGVSASDAAVIADMVRTDLVKQGVFSVIEKGSMDKILAEQSFQQTGCTTQECAVKLGRILNVRYLMVGSFGKLMDQYVLNFRVIDVESAKVVYSDDARGLSSQIQVSDAIHQMTMKMAKAVEKK